jgi:hypothetical protein
MNVIEAVKFFEENPRATAREAGLTTADANFLVGQGKLMQAGARVTGKRGRPPMEYVVAGTELDDGGFAQQQVERAKRVLRAHRHYERLSNAIMRAANEFGHGSDQHTEAKELRRETFLVFPPIPSKNDYLLAGEATLDELDEPLPVIEEDDES